MSRWSLACALVLPALVWAQDKVELNRITMVEVKAGTVEIRGSRQPSFTTFTMSDPPRLVVDISEAVFANVPEVIAGAGQITGVKTASYGSASAAIARVLIGFSAEVETDLEAQGQTLVVKIVSGGRPAVAQLEAGPQSGQSTQDARAAAEADRKRQEEAAMEAARRAEEERKAQEQAAREAAARAEEARRAQEAAAKAAQQEARRAAEEERRRQDEAAKEAARAAEAERARQQEEARRAAEAQKARKAEEARAAKQAQEEERRRKQEEAAQRRQAEEEAKKAQEAQRRAEQEAKRAAEADRQRAEAEAREAARRAQEERARQQQEARKAEAAAKEALREERRRQEEEARAAAAAARRAEEAARKAGAEERKRQQEEARRAEVEARQAARAPQGQRPSTGARNTLTLVGFRPAGGLSRVFIRTEAPARYEIREADEQTIIVSLANTRIGSSNNARFLDTSFFDTPVQGVNPTEQGGEVQVEIKLKAQVPYQARQDGPELVLEFQGQ